MNKNLNTIARGSLCYFINGPKKESATHRHNGLDFEVTTCSYGTRTMSVWQGEERLYFSGGGDSKEASTGKEVEVIAGPYKAIFTPTSRERLENCNYIIYELNE